MKRGDIFLARLDPAEGTEANKTRPVVVVSNNGANDTAQRLGRGVVTVVPLTTNTTRVLSFQTYVTGGGMTGLDRDSKAQAEQVRAIDVRRLIHRMGCLDPLELRRLDDALRTQLDSCPQHSRRTCLRT